MSKLDKDQVIEKFTEAYTAANGKAPEIEAKGGWYSIDGGKNVRLTQLDEMADQLAAGQKDTTNTEALKEEPAKTTELKVESAAPEAVAKKQTTGFSVKQFWNELLDTQKPGSILPR